MPTLHQSIVEEFLAALAAMPEFDKNKLDQIKALLGATKKLKPEDLVAIFSLSPGGEIK